MIVCGCGEEQSLVKTYGQFFLLLYENLTENTLDINKKD